MSPERLQYVREAHARGMEPHWYHTVTSELLAEIDRMRPVVEAAQAWRTALAQADDVGVQIQDLAAFRASEELCQAVDVLAAVGGTEAS